MLVSATYLLPGENFKVLLQPLPELLTGHFNFLFVSKEHVDILLWDDVTTFICIMIPFLYFTNRQ
jgi:hypothetical protein